MGRAMSFEEAWAAAELPSADTWPGLSTDERRYREGVLADIARRVADEGVHRALPGDERGRLFMPFAALKGYGDVIEDVEEQVEKQFGG